MRSDLTKRSAAETVGTGFLLAAVVGSGIMGQRLADGNVAIALLVNTVSTGAALVALILAFGPYRARISTRRSQSLMRGRRVSPGGTCLSWWPLKALARSPAWQALI